MQADTQSTPSLIIKNVLMNWLALAVSLGSGFLMSPFLVGHLGDSVYGVWVLVGSLVGYLGLLDFGITPSIVKYVAEHRARGDQEAINRVVTVGLTVFSILGIACLAASAGVALFFNSIFRTPLSYSTATAVVMIAGLNLALSFPASVFVGLVRGYQRYDLDAGITSLTIIVRSVLVVVLVRSGQGLLAVALTTFAFDMLRLLYLVRCGYRLNPEIRVARRYYDAGIRRRLFGYSVYIFIIVVAKQFIFYTDSIVIGLFLSTALVTVFFVASRLASYLRMLVSDMVGVMTPTAADFDARSDRAGVNALLVAGTKYTLLISLPAAAILFVLGDRFIELWMGPGYRQSATILAILTAGVLINLIEMPVDTVLRGVGKHRIVARFTVLQGVANLILSLLLVVPFGLVGVALGTAIPMIVFTAIAFPVYFRQLGLPLRDWVRQSMPGPLIAQAPFVALLIVLRLYALPSSLLWFLIVVGGALVLYAALVAAVCMSPAERFAFWRLTEALGLRPAPRYSSAARQAN
jgi:O-antigen/teichoic acid export membrane protein